MSKMQGWNPDPFGRFEHRYSSNGAPTTLVRTGTVEGQDEPDDGRNGAGAADSPARPSIGPVALRPHLYERRQRRLIGWIVLGVAFALPLVAWELLVTTIGDRVFGFAAFAFVAAILVVLLRVSCGPDGPRARLSACDSMPRTSSTDRRTPSR